MREPLVLLEALLDLLREHDLLDGNVGELLDSLRERLSAEKLVVAFVAEFSRGKSELINAIFLADAGRRILPSSPGSTTMCPVELAWDPDDPPGLALLPIGMMLKLAPLACARISAARFGIDPREVVVSGTAPGFAFAAAIASASVFGPVAALATNSIGVSATTTTGSMSFSRSYFAAR